MALTFKSVLRAFRIVPAMPPALPFYSTEGNADLACDEYGVLWVRAAPGGGGGGSGSLVNSATFTSLEAGPGLATSYIARDEAAVGAVALQSVQAHATEFCYLQLFGHNTPSEGEFPLFEWACPYAEGVSQEFGFPWGLHIPTETGLTFYFSSTPGQLTSGVYGVVQGIYTYASP